MRQIKVHKSSFFKRAILLFWELYVNFRFVKYEDFFEYEERNDFRYTKMRAEVSLGYKINLEDPKTFNEKLIARRLFSRSPVWAKVTDKNKVRQWLVENGYLEKILLVPAVKCVSLDDLLKYKVTHPVVIKAAWASGRNVFVSNQKELLDNMKLFKKWLDEPYKVSTLIWASTQNPRSFIVEDKLSLKNGNVPVDYKFFVFNGRVSFIQVDVDRFSEHTRALFDRGGNRLPYSYCSYETTTSDYHLPEYVTSRMIDVAEKLGAKFSFIRVDLYWFDGKVFFGELTQTPSAGFGRLSSIDFDMELGEAWRDFDKYGM
jgi:hypothetical protein